MKINRALAVSSTVQSAGPSGVRSPESYQDFIQKKITLDKDHGIPVEPSAIHALLKPHQRDVVEWACRGGRRAIFASFGLGKTLMQLEIMRQILGKEPGDGLIVCPLGVRQEFIRDAKKLDLPVAFIRTDEDVLQTNAIEQARVFLTNYESVREGKINPAQFTVTSLDEAAILRSFGGTKTYREFMRGFENVKYRFVATATPDPNEYIELLAYSAYLGIMDVSQAKAQPLDASILTPNGWKLMADIRVGDDVIAADGMATKVLGVYPQGMRKVYQVKFDDGSLVECDLEHLWLTSNQYERNNERRFARFTGRKTKNRRRATAVFQTVKTTQQISLTLRSRKNLNHQIFSVKAVEFSPRAIAIDPYLLGVLLGDGYLRKSNVSFSSADQWIIDQVRPRIPAGLLIKKKPQGLYDYYIVNPEGRGKRNVLVQTLRSYALNGKRSHEKHIPEDYLFNSISVRLAILRGLMDTDGTVDPINGSSFTTTSEQLAKDVTFLVRSLGGVVRTIKRKTTGKDAYRVGVSLPESINPFSLPRKAIKVKSKSRFGLARAISSVECAGEKPMQCLAIAHPSRLYVTNDFILTHNTRFFKRDTTKADKLTLHAHHADDFWNWVSSWAIFLQKPSNLGYSDEGYSLPEMEIIEHVIDVSDSSAGTQERDGQWKMFRDAASGVSEAAREKRLTLDARIVKMREIIAESPEDHFLLWHDLEAEREAIESAIPRCASVYGAQSLDEREEIISLFSDGHIQYLAAKPVMLGSGTNMQFFCHRAIFLGISFKFAQFIQALHRIQRFLQPYPVRIDLIYASTEKRIRDVLFGKWDRYKLQTAKMSELIRAYGLSQTGKLGNMKRTATCERVEVTGETYRLVCNDAVAEMPSITDNSVGLILTSLPFSTQYEYSPSYLDFGHTESNAHFFEQMDFLTPELFRVLEPGRLAVIHVKDRIIPGGLTGLGFQTVYPLHADCIAHYTRHGFGYLGMKTIVTDVVRENNQTYRLGWTEQCKDATKMGVGMPEYLLLFRKPPTSTERSYADNPVKKSKKKYTRGRWQVDAHAFTRSNGNRPLTSEDLEGIPHATIFKMFRKYSQEAVYDFERHVRLAESLDEKQRLPVTFMLLQPASWSPEVWSDVARMRTLNMLQAQKGRQMHLCPMQFDIARRVIEQYSMPRETVLDPFSGIGTVPMCAVELGRKTIGIELSKSYFLDGAMYTEMAAQKLKSPTLLDLTEAQENAETETKEETQS